MSESGVQQIVTSDHFSAALWYWIRMALACAIAATAGFWVHVLYGRGLAEAYVQNAAHGGRLHVLHEPYPAAVVVIAYATALLPAVGKVLTYMLLKDKLPGEGRLAKGLCFGLLLMAMTDALLRLPVMNFVIGNPLDVVIVQSLEGWLIGPATGIAIAMLVP